MAKWVAAALAAILLGIFSLRLDWWERAPVPLDAPFLFRDGFEDGTARWHGFQREPEANSVAVTTRRAHSGSRSLECHAVPNSRGSKADIFIGGLHFVRNDHVWFRGWYYLEGAQDASLLFLWDLEASRKYQSPGRRLYLQDGGTISSDLGKWWGRNTFRQPRQTAIPFPHDRWVELRAHLFLSEDSNGRLEVWQDGARILDASGRTLPTARAIYDRLQVGITFNGNRSHALTVLVDDVELANRPLG